MDFNTLHDMDLNGKIVLLRADLNVPVDADKNITDTTRIDRLKPTIDLLAAKGAKTLILSHFGRPKGEHNSEFSLAFLPPALQKQWGVEVQFAEDCIDIPAQNVAANLKNGQFGLLENLRFHKGEEANDHEFAQKLAALGDLFVNDAFSAAHRAHASTEALAHLLPCAAGLLMEAELTALQDALEAPDHPVIALVGGAKISSKLDVLGNLIKKVDMLILGGGMANTFLYAQGHDLKASLCEKDMADTARDIMAQAKTHNCEIILPIDGVAAEKFAANAPHTTCGNDAIPDGTMVLDIGAGTIEMLKGKISTAKTLLWNGPMGAFELTPFDNGTVQLARFAAECTKNGTLKSVAGGGDTVAALEQANAAKDFTYISTAGGAFLEWLEGKTLPGVAALSQKSCTKQCA